MLFIFLRQHERTYLFTTDPDDITFFSLPLKLGKHIGTNIISSHGKAQNEFFKIRQVHQVLSQINIRITDENNVNLR